MPVNVGVDGTAILIRRALWRRRIAQTAALTLCSLFIPSSLFAKVLSSKSEIADLPQKAPVASVVSATGREMPVEQSTRFVTIINREEIEKSGKIYVIDLLRAQPGVSVAQTGPPGRSAGIFIRGTNTNHTIVLVDGVEINSPTTGDADLADLTLENILPVQDIDRIEILRGPQSVLYGSDALSGVINIVTKPGGKAGMHGNGRFEYGTHETFYETGGLSGDWKRFSFSGSGARLDSDGPGENDGFENTRGFGHGKINVTENSDFDVAFHYYNALTGIEDGAFTQEWTAYVTSCFRLSKNIACLRSRGCADCPGRVRRHP